MSGHSIAEHLKFIEKRDNKSVKKQGVKKVIKDTTVKSDFVTKF